MFSKRNPQDVWWNISLNILTGIEAEVVVIKKTGCHNFLYFDHKSSWH